MATAILGLIKQASNSAMNYCLRLCLNFNWSVVELLAQCHTLRIQQHFLLLFCSNNPKQQT